MRFQEKERYKHKLKELIDERPGNYKTISCPSCQQDIPAKNVNIHDKIAKCTDCNVIFSISGEVADLLSPRQIKQEVIRPEGIDIFYFQDDLDFTIQQPLNMLDLMGAIFLPLFAFLFTLIFFKKDISVVWPGIMWLLSLVPIFNLARRTEDKIHLSIDDRYLSIRWRPRKFQKDQQFAIHEIDQIYVKSMHGQSSIYMVVNGIEGQKHVPLISRLDSLSKARYLEQEIERHLEITDRQIPEEMV